MPRRHICELNGWHRPEIDSVRSTGQGVWALPMWLSISPSHLFCCRNNKKGQQQLLSNVLFLPKLLKFDASKRSASKICYKVNLQLQNGKALGCTLMDRQNWPQHWTMFYNPEHYSAIHARLSFQDPMCQDNLTESTGKSGRKFLLSLISEGKAEVTLRMVWS